MMTFLKRFWDTGTSEREAAAALYLKAVEKAREPAFYLEFDVPDTIDGRFDMIVIHTGLTVRRLRTAGDEHTATVAQEMFDLMFLDFDRSLRELGVGDLSVGKHIKKMGQAWYARVAAHDASIDKAAQGNIHALEQTLQDTLFRSLAPAPHLAAMARYVLRANAHLQAQDLKALAEGRVDWSVPVTETRA
jgi:cytochrome b pre-mRNA-processing protein 3